MIAHQVIENIHEAYAFEKSQAAAKGGGKEDAAPNAYVAMRQRMGLKPKA